MIGDEAGGQPVVLGWLESFYNSELSSAASVSVVFCWTSLEALP
jgi:heme O synthase-like polyprenyltransferase